jgi:heat shock protein HslJ
VPDVQNMTQRSRVSCAGSHPKFGVVTATLFLLSVVVAASCGCSDRSANADKAPAASEAPQAGPLAHLAGTSWRLLEIQSMDHAIGTTKPDDPSLYTMRLNADGTVTMRLNCNRGNGTWSAKPVADGSSGTFEFGPIAATRALCPPPSLDEDEKLATQMGYVRSYLLNDGRLYRPLSRPIY